LLGLSLNPLEKDVHWYARDEDEASVTATKKAEEIRKIKKAKEDALVALYIPIFPLVLSLPSWPLGSAISIVGERMGIVPL
jgi:hypothetical protein